MRRRLFQPVTGKEAHAGLDALARSFSQLCGGQPQEFPAECEEGEHERRLKRACPIHPELFDRLYNTWSTLDRFERNRGVLRLMAKVIYSLWSRDDRSLLIMPESVPIAVRRVARTIFMGSAPGMAAAHRGIDERAIKLG